MRFKKAMAGVGEAGIGIIMAQQGLKEWVAQTGAMQDALSGAYNATTQSINHYLPASSLIPYLGESQQILMLAAGAVTLAAGGFAARSIYRSIPAV